MATTDVENVSTKTEGIVLEKPVNCESGTKADKEQTNGKVHEEKENAATEVQKEESAKKEEIAVKVEPKTGVSFPVKLDDGKQLNCVGLRKKYMLGMGIKVYGFGTYADNEKLKDLLRSKIGKAPAKPTKEMYQVVIDAAVTVQMVIVFSKVTTSMVRKNFDGHGASLKKLTGGRKNEDLETNRVMGQASDDVQLTSGSVIEISLLPEYTLQTRVIGEVVSKVESELICRAYVHMYVGDDAFDKDAKDKFGMSLFSLF